MKPSILFPMYLSIRPKCNCVMNEQASFNTTTLRANTHTLVCMVYQNHQTLSQQAVNYDFSILLSLKGGI